MSQVIRERTYIGKNQQTLLTKLAKAWDVNEAEVICQAIEREAASGLAQHLAPDPAALEEIIRFALRRRAHGVTGAPVRWCREEAYAVHVMRSRIHESRIRSCAADQVDRPQDVRHGMRSRIHESGVTPPCLADIVTS